METEFLDDNQDLDETENCTRVSRKDFLGTEFYRPKKRARVKRNRSEIPKIRDELMTEKTKDDDRVNSTKKKVLLVKGIGFSPSDSKDLDIPNDEVLKSIKNSLIPDSEIALLLSNKFWESNVKLIEKCLKVFSRDRIADWFVRTMEIEGCGGLLIKSGDRKRTTGGVFLHLIRSEASKEESIAALGIGFQPMKKSKHTFGKRFAKDYLVVSGQKETSNEKIFENPVKRNPFATKLNSDSIEMDYQIKPYGESEDIGILVE